MSIFPELLSWDRGNRKFSYGDLNIEVVEAKPGFEDENKHVDYKFVSDVNGLKLVLHAYNGKQRLTVCGQNYMNFVDKFLEPYYTKKVESFAAEANIYNKNVLSAFGKTVKRVNVKYKTSTPLACKECIQVSKSITQLHTHMKFQHEMSLSLISH